MFCGEVTAVASHHDREVDYGRIELYCDNPECEAREFVVLMVRGEGAHMRADVRALAAVDQYAPQAEPIEEDPPEESYDRELSDADMWWRGIHRLRQEAVNSGDVTTRRRLSRSAFRIHVD